MTAFLHGQRKCYFIPKKDFQRTIKLRLSSSKALSKGNRYLLTSYNVNNVTDCGPRDDNPNVTLIAQVVKQDCILHFAT